MNREWQWKSRSGKAFFNFGIGRQNAVGTEHPASDVPIGEGLRLAASEGISRWWKLLTAIAVVRVMTKKRRRK